MTPAPCESSQAPGRLSTLLGATAHCSPWSASGAACSVLVRDAPTFGQYRARSESLLTPSARATSDFIAKLLRSCAGASASGCAPMRASARVSDRPPR